MISNVLKKTNTSAFDAWLDKAPGGPLFDLIHAAADSDHDSGEQQSLPLIGIQALQEIPILYDKFRAADRLVQHAKV